MTALSPRHSEHKGKPVRVLYDVPWSISKDLLRIWVRLILDQNRQSILQLAKHNNAANCIKSINKCQKKDKKPPDFIHDQIIWEVLFSMSSITLLVKYYSHNVPYCVVLLILYQCYPNRNKALSNSSQPASATST